MFGGQLKSQNLQSQRSSTKQLVIVGRGSCGEDERNSASGGGALLGALSRKVPSFGDDTFRALFSFHFSSEVITALTGKRCERIELPNNSSQNHAVDWGNESSVPSPSLFAQAESRWNRTKVIPGPEKSKLVHLRTLFPHGLKLAMKLEVMELLFILPPAVFFCVFSLFRHV